MQHTKTSINEDIAKDPHKAATKIQAIQRGRKARSSIKDKLLKKSSTAYSIDENSTMAEIRHALEAKGIDTQTEGKHRDERKLILLQRLRDAKEVGENNAEEVGEESDADEEAEEGEEDADKEGE